MDLQSMLKKKAAQDSAFQSVLDDCKSKVEFFFGDNGVKDRLAGWMMDVDTFVVDQTQKSQASVLNLRI